MTLVDKDFLKAFEEYPLYAKEGTTDPLVVVKLFDVAGAGTWFLTEFDAATNTAFGYVTGLGENEWGYVDLPELEELRHPQLGIPRIERDLYFKQKPLSQVLLEAMV